MDLFIAAIGNNLKSINRQLFVYEESYIKERHFPAFVITDVSVEPAPINGVLKPLGRQNPINVRFNFTGRLIFREDNKNYDENKFQIRDELYNQVLRTLLDRPSFLNTRMLDQEFVGANRSVEEIDGNIKVIFDISISYLMRQDWSVGLSAVEMFSATQFWDQPFSDI